jgi:hypothetical protein
MGIVQLALTVYGEYLAIKSLPPGEKRRPHLLGIGGLGCLAVALTVCIGIQSYESEKQAESVQTQLKRDLAAANQKLENQTGQLTTIAEMLGVNSNDPVVLAAVLAQNFCGPQIWSRARSLRKPLDCWPSNFIARIRSRWDALWSYVRLLWRHSWISRRNTVFPHYGTALRTSKRNARLLTVSKRDRCSRLISACYLDQT